MPTTPTHPAATHATRKVALITGGAKRVGRAIALHLARRNYDVVVTYRTSKGPAQSLAEEIAAAGGRCHLIHADLTHDSAADTIAADHASSPLAHRLDLLVHNASVFPKATFDQTTPELLREVLKLHLETPFFLTQRLAPLLRASGGCVVSMTDLAADRPFKDYLAYSASKAALANLTIGLARVLAPEARANAIAPGAVEFPEDMPEEARQAYLKRVPAGRVGTPEEVAAVVYWLAEEAKYVTGQTIRVDGGRSIS